ncbi:MAG TPA: ATP-binding protein [Dissulfurispiraceae bacterium]
MDDKKKTRKQLIDELGALRLKAAFLEKAEKRHRKAKEALQRSEKVRREITSSLGEGIYMVDGKGELIFMNPEAERLLGWTEAELFGKDIHDTIHYLKKDGTPLHAADCPVHKVITTGGKHYIDDDVFVRKDGRLLPVAYVATPVLEKGKIVASITAFHDITDRKRMTAELINAKKLESVGVLASGIAHDFNNLLTVILSYISLSKALVKADEEIFENLSLAEKASRQAKDLIHQLFTFSKIGETAKRATSISKLIKDSIAFSLSDSDIKCELSISDGLRPVEVDEGQIGRVLYNLLVNAKESMPGGGIIKVRAENVPFRQEDRFPLEKGEYIRISVEDQGSGIRKEYIQKIFDPYFTTKKKGTQKGTGLGLAICYSIIKNHNGYIVAESTIGVGTVFHIYLPVSEGGQPGGRLP